MEDQPLMTTINKVILIGNLGKDPEIRYLENGSIMAKFSMATSEIYTDRKTGEKKEIKDWHDIVAWGELAEIIEKKLRKGHKIYIEGKLKKRCWQDKQKLTHYSVDVVADEMIILSKINFDETSKRNPPYTEEGTPLPPKPMLNFDANENNETPI